MQPFQIKSFPLTRTVVSLTSTANRYVVSYALKTNSLLLPVTTVTVMSSLIQVIITQFRGQQCMPPKFEDYNLCTSV